jgi:hypothetical protein
LRANSRLFTMVCVNTPFEGRADSMDSTDSAGGFCKEEVS